MKGQVKYPKATRINLEIFIRKKILLPDVATMRGSAPGNPGPGPKCHICGEGNGLLHRKC